MCVSIPALSFSCGTFVQIYDKILRAKALSIVHSCSSVLGVMSGVYKVSS